MPLSITGHGFLHIPNLSPGSTKIQDPMADVADISIFHMPPEHVHLNRSAGQKIYGVNLEEPLKIGAIQKNETIDD